MSTDAEFEKIRAKINARVEAEQKLTKNQRNRLLQYEKNHGVLLTGEEIEKKFLPHGVFGR